jgi:ATP phosphoribosyltransferase regulatory subunit
MIDEPAAPADVLAAIRAPFAALKAVAIDPPVIQPLSLLLDLAGEAMRARLYIVQGEGDAEACLRPDFTIPVTRAHIASGQAACRYTYDGKAFRAAPANSNRAREFLQLGLEAFGEGLDPAVDGEVVALAWRAAAAGGRDDLSLVFGDVALFSSFIDALGVAPPLAARLKRAFSRPRALQLELGRDHDAVRPARQGDRVSALLAGLPEAEATAVLEDLWAIAGIAPVGGRSAAEIVHRLVQRAEAAHAPRLTGAEAGLVREFLDISDRPPAALAKVASLAKRGKVNLDAALEGWAKRLSIVMGAGVSETQMTLSTGFGRAFGYYDGFLFEVRSAALGDWASVAGGGRYDGLPARLGGKVGGGAVGCMVRPMRAWSGSEQGL